MFISLYYALYLVYTGSTAAYKDDVETDGKYSVHNALQLALISAPISSNQCTIRLLIKVEIFSFNHSYILFYVHSIMLD